MENKKTYENITVDVIIPVYNVEPYLKRCLDSLIGQTYEGWRAICVDDGSTDGCADILAAYAASDSRFRVLRKENGGLSDARNYGVEASDADYIMFLDSDDFIHPQTLEIATYLALRDGSDVVTWYRDARYRNVELKFRRFFHLDTIDYRPSSMDIRYDLESIESYRTDDLLGHSGNWYKSPGKGYIKHCYVWRHLFRRTAIADVKFIKGIRYEDIPWWGEVLIKPLTSTMTDLRLYYYYLNPTSISREASSAEKHKAVFTALHRAYDVYKSKATPEQQHTWSRNFKWEFLRRDLTKIMKSRRMRTDAGLLAVIREMLLDGMLDDASTREELEIRERIARQLEERKASREA